MAIENTQLQQAMLERLMAGPNVNRQASNAVREIVERERQRARVNPQVVGGQPSTATAGPTAPNPTQTSQPRPAPEVPQVTAGAANQGAPAAQPAPATPPAQTATGLPQPQTPQADTDVGIDAAFQEFLRARMRGEGQMTLEERLSNQFDPLASRLEDSFARAEEEALEQLAAKGRLDSGATDRTIQDFQGELASRKAQALGQITVEHERTRQQNINAAIQSFGILEGNRVSSKTQLTQANLQAATVIQQELLNSAARIRSAQIGAGATVEAAGLASKARTQAAKISAQAALQRAGMDFDLAMQQIDNEMVMKGIDPNRLENDPAYRQGVLERQAYLEDVKRKLLEAQAAEAGFALAGV